MRVGFSSSPKFVEHVTSPSHPERPDRIRAIHRAVRLAGMINSPDPFPDFEIDLGLLKQTDLKLVEIDPTLADPKWLTLVHTPAMIERTRRICEAGGGVLDSGDTPVGV